MEAINRNSNLIGVSNLQVPKEPTGAKETTFISDKPVPQEPAQMQELQKSDSEILDALDDAQKDYSEPIQEFSEEFQGVDDTKKDTSEAKMSDLGMDFSDIAKDSFDEPQIIDDTRKDIDGSEIKDEESDFSSDGERIANEPQDNLQIPREPENIAFRPIEPDSQTGTDRNAPIE